MALDKTIITKRLTYIKYLYQQGVEQSKLPEVIAGFALMQFHDCIEMFLLLVAENLGKKEYTKWTFMQYWTEIGTLTMRDAMNTMKQRRVSLKHQGSFPSHDDVVECRINVGTFLRIVNDKQKRNVFTPECVHPGDGCFFVQGSHRLKSPLQ